jgi:hypothetical protein
LVLSTSSSSYSSSNFALLLTVLCLGPKVWAEMRHICRIVAVAVPVAAKGEVGMVRAGTG